ncbi:MAG TPA: hypothetical protein VHN14_27410, partial [Kofleriaceae bacterium]|nr:hypothetical protein [Kofleriaceae bacterium]
MEQFGSEEHSDSPVTLQVYEKAGFASGSPLAVHATGGQQAMPRALLVLCMTVWVTGAVASADP